MARTVTTARLSSRLKPPSELWLGLEMRKSLQVQVVRNERSSVDGDLVTPLIPWSVVTCKITSSRPL